MARKERKKSKKNIPNDMIDYYVMYSLDRKLDTKEIRKLLLQKQGEIRSNMSNGALNSKEILEKLQEAYQTIAAAVKTFKNDERRKEYDELLDAAYEAGRIDVASQTMAKELYEELQAMFVRGNYKGVIRKCMEALEENIRDYRLYILLAQSYFALNDIDTSLKKVDEGLNVHQDNMELLRAGARFSNDGKKDYNKAQKYVNRMLEIDAESPLVASEQSYLYLTSGKEDLAYKTIDEYLEKHPNDNEFRRDCAYDLIGYSYSCYTKEPIEGAYVIASEEDYNKCLSTCNKAASLYSDENVQSALENAKYYGTVEFNEENKEHIFWLKVCGIMLMAVGVFASVGFFVGIIGTIFSGLGTDTLGNNGIGMIIPYVLLGLMQFYYGKKYFSASKKLKQLSYRPYWQINKFIMTGKREPEEEKYMKIGSRVTNAVRLSIKLSIEIIKLVFRFI